MELVVPAGQDMATKADISEAVNTLTARMDRLATKEYVLRMLLIALTTALTSGCSDCRSASSLAGTSTVELAQDSKLSRRQPFAVGTRTRS